MSRNLLEEVKSYELNKKHAGRFRSEKIEIFLFLLSIFEYLSCLIDDMFLIKNPKILNIHVRDYLKWLEFYLFLFLREQGNHRTD